MLETASKAPISGDVEVMHNLADIALIEQLLDQQPAHRLANKLKRNYFEAKVRVEDLGISVPAELRGLRQSCGWCSTKINAILNRLGFLAWYENPENPIGLNSIFEANYLETESQFVHQDLLVYGVAFALVSAGDENNDETEVLITAESPDNVEVDYNPRTRKVNAGVIVTVEEKEYKEIIFVDKWRTIPFRYANGTWTELEGGTYHNLGRCPLVMFVNRGETNRKGGHSEITEPMMSYTQTALRTMMEMEIAREFYAIPQKYITGVVRAMFEDDDGELRDKISVMMDQVLMLPDVQTGEDAEGNPIMQRAEAGQFSSNNPAVFTEILRYVAQQFSAEAMIPQDYLGLTTVNPVGGDAARQADARLIDKGNYIMRQLKKPWTEVAEIAILTRDGELPEGFTAKPRFKDLSTPARSATADELTKLIGAGILRSDSEIVYNRLDLTQEEREILRTENSMANAQSVLSMLAKGGTEGTETPAGATTPATTPVALDDEQAAA